MHSTWNAPPSRCSRAPTTSATAPPMPASTSSKMSVLPGASVDRQRLQREHDARQLAARRDARQRLQVFAGVRRDVELRRRRCRGRSTAPRHRAARSGPRTASSAIASSPSAFSRALANTSRGCAPPRPRARAATLSIRRVARSPARHRAPRRARSRARGRAARCRSARAWSRRRPATVRASSSAARAAPGDPRPPGAAPATRRCLRRTIARKNARSSSCDLMRVARVEVRREPRVERRQLADLLPHRAERRQRRARRLRTAPCRLRAHSRWRRSALASTCASASSSSSSPGCGFDAIDLGELEREELRSRGLLLLGLRRSRCALVAQPLPSARTPLPPLRVAASATANSSSRSRCAADRAAPDVRAGRADRRASRTASRSAALVASAPSTNARLRPCAEISRRTIISLPSGVSKIASTVAVSSPVRTRSAEARPPSSRPTASTRIDLPAPVSPVRTFKPGLELELETVDDGEVADAEKAKHSGCTADVRAEVQSYQMFDSA